MHRIKMVCQRRPTNLQSGSRVISDGQSRPNACKFKIWADNGPPTSPGVGNQRRYARANYATFGGVNRRRRGGKARGKRAARSASLIKNITTRWWAIVSPNHVCPPRVQNDWGWQIDHPKTVVQAGGRSGRNHIACYQRVVSGTRT